MMAPRSIRFPRRCLVAVFLFLGSITLRNAQGPNTAVLLDPKHPEMHQPAPGAFKVLLDTSKGEIAIEIKREWSPNGVDRFYNLVQHDPNGRTTQVFINLRDNSATHDAEPFVPFGRVLQGMEVADALYSEYGEEAGGGIRAGRQDKLFEEGNAYLEREFPRLDYIKQARVIR